MEITFYVDILIVNHAKSFNSLPKKSSVDKFTKIL
jgi:hypothetical protein